MTRAAFAVCLFFVALFLAPGARAASALAGATVEAPHWQVGSEWRYSDGYALKVTSTSPKGAVFQRLDAPGESFSRLGFIRTDSTSTAVTRTAIYRTVPDAAGAVLSGDKPLIFQREYLNNGKLMVHASSWSVEGRQTITVPAGTFDCWIIVWRTRSLRSDWTGYERWWYSPQAQNYVRMEFKYGPGEDSSRVLMSYSLPVSPPTPVAAAAVSEPAPASAPLSPAAIAPVAAMPPAPAASPALEPVSVPVSQPMMPPAAEPTSAPAVAPLPVVPPAPAVNAVQAMLRQPAVPPGPALNAVQAMLREPAVPPAPVQMAQRDILPTTPVPEVQPVALQPQVTGDETKPAQRDLVVPAAAIAPLLRVPVATKVAAVAEVKQKDIPDLTPVKKIAGRSRAPRQFAGVTHRDVPRLFHIALAPYDGMQDAWSLCPRLNSAGASGCVLPCPVSWTMQSGPLTPCIGPNAIMAPARQTSSSQQTGSRRIPSARHDAPKAHTRLALAAAPPGPQLLALLERSFGRWFR